MPKSKNRSDKKRSGKLKQIRMRNAHAKHSVIVENERQAKAVEEMIERYKSQQSTKRSERIEKLAAEKPEESITSAFANAANGIVMPPPPTDD